MKETRIKEEPIDEDIGVKPKKRVKRGNKSVVDLPFNEEVSKIEDEVTTVTKAEEMKEETKEPTDPFENHAQKLIEDVHNDELLLASLKHLMDRSDLDEIIMSLDFVIKSYRLVNKFQLADTSYHRATTK